MRQTALLNQERKIEFAKATLAKFLHLDSHWMSKSFANPEAQVFTARFQ